MLVSSHSGVWIKKQTFGNRSYFHTSIFLPFFNSLTLTFPSLTLTPTLTLGSWSAKVVFTPAVFSQFKSTSGLFSLSARFVCAGVKTVIALECKTKQPNQLPSVCYKFELNIILYKHMSFEADDVRVQVSPSFLDIKSEYMEFIFSSLHRLTADEKIWFINEAHGLWL